MAVDNFRGGTIITNDPVPQRPDGSDGRDDIHRFRIKVLKGAMELELKGIRVNRRGAFACIKQEFGLRGQNKRVYREFCKMHGLDPKEV